jgi:hypothetical protein
MFADDGGFGIAEHAIHHLFGFGDGFGGAGEFREERFGIGDFPADEDRSQNIEAILREAFRELVFEILNALVEAMDAFDGPRPLEVRTRLGDIASRLAEGSDDDDFGFADLEYEQEQADNEDQEDADRENEWVAFHGKGDYLGAGTFMLRMSRATDS